MSEKRSINMTHPHSSVPKHKPSDYQTVKTVRPVSDHQSDQTRIRPVSDQHQTIRLSDQIRLASDQHQTIRPSEPQSDQKHQTSIRPSSDSHQTTIRPSPRPDSGRSGLACRERHTAAADARDSARNRSDAATTSASGETGARLKNAERDKCRNCG